MWNWKLMHEDEEVICYCDIDSINDPVEDENGYYRSIECYQVIPNRVAAWMSFFIKNKETIRYYIEQREKAGLPIKGYQDFNNVLCLVEIDSEKMLYRVIPAIDYDDKSNELGQSTALDIEGQDLLKGMKGDWSPIRPRKTHKAIHALFKFVYTNHRV
ncbi:MAG: hypothetical protein NT178_04850 [Proteobacteria bacterium]|nr:hypothetical protein [Pseudomonadota bacterium]